MENCILFNILVKNTNLAIFPVLFSYAVVMAKLYDVKSLLIALIVHTKLAHQPVDAIFHQPMKSRPDSQFLIKSRSRYALSTVINPFSSTLPRLASLV